MTDIDPREAMTPEQIADALRLRLERDHANLHADAAIEEVERLRGTHRENYDAFTAMRNDINGLIGNMDSSESTLLDGPEMGHECAAVVEAVAAYVARTEAALATARAEALYDAITTALAALSGDDQ